MRDICWSVVAAIVGEVSVVVRVLYVDGPQQVKEVILFETNT